MKRIYSILALTLIFVASSCNKENTLENLNAIQNVSIVPVYSDGSIKVPEDGILTIDCIVTPAAAVKGLSAQNFKVIIANTVTKAAGYSIFDASSVDIDDSIGAVTVKADVSSIFPLDIRSSLAVALNIKNDGIDYTSSFVNAASMNDNFSVSGIRPSVEMTVVVPVELSSLEYFDYAIRYSDNHGAMEADTVRYNGIGSYNNNCYTRTFSYDGLPVTCRVTVEMIPKKDRSSVVSFNFYTPKPYIFPNVYHSDSSIERENPDRIVRGLEPIRIDDMSIGSFQSMYGTTFLSICGVYYSDYGYELFFY